jgi:hypothetical protein
MDMQTGNSIRILPNPVNDMLQVQLNVRAACNMQACLYDVNGRIVYRMKRDLQPGFNVITINDLADKPPGVYTMLINAGDQVFSRKLMIVR